MSEEISPSENQPKKSRKHLAVIIILAVVASSLIIGGSIFWYQNIQCGLACGPPIDVPVIQSAEVIQSSSLKTNCQIVSSNLIANCQVSLSPGEVGVIRLNMTSKNGDSRVQFKANSSETSYIQFVSLPNCTYVSSPNFTASGCIVLGGGSSFLFNYTVSKSLPAIEHITLSIFVTKTCCWP
ncbi:MAG: hypothetical protein JRN15_00235 [Nitrososphaerota archaeon]|nr:hypothetical protein [Nitrososphaerota archaeon]